MIQQTTTVSNMAREMAKNRTTAYVVTESSGASSSSSSTVVVVGVLGIVSEQDVVRKVIAEDKSPNEMTIGDIMTRNPYCLYESMNVESEALKLMSQFGIRHVPILDDPTTKGYSRTVDVLEAAIYAVKQRPSLIESMSQISKRLIRNFSAASSATANNNNNNKRTSANLSNNNNATNEDVDFLSSGTTVVEAAKYMTSKKRSAVLVRNRYGATGIVTESDLVRRVLGDNLPPTTTTLGDIMTPNPLCIDAAAEPNEILKTMLKKRFRHVPVKNSKTGELIMILDIIGVLRSALRIEPVVVASSTVAALPPRAIPTPPLTAAPVDATTTANNPNSEASKPPPVPAPLEKRPFEASAQKAATALAEGRVRDAMEALTLALAEYEKEENKNEKDGVRSRMRCKRGILLNALGEREAAVEDLNMVVEAPRGEVSEEVREEARAALAETQLELNRIEVAFSLASGLSSDRAKAAFRRCALEEYEAVKEIGKSLFAKGLNEDAINSFTTCVRIHVGLSSGNAAEEEKETAAAERRRGAVAYSNRAACYQAMRLYEASLEDCRASIKCDESYDKSWVRSCQCLEALERHEERATCAERGMKALGKREARLMAHLEGARGVLLSSRLFAGRDENDGGLSNQQHHPVVAPTNVVKEDDMRAKVRALGGIMKALSSTKSGETTTTPRGGVEDEEMAML